MSETTATDLLRVLDATVRRDSGLPGLIGSVAIGVREGASERWWRATFGRRVETTRLGRRPEQSDAALLLDAEAARAILALTALPAAAEIELSGDPQLIRRFLDRYLRPTGMVALRALNAPVRSTSRRRGARS